MSIYSNLPFIYQKSSDFAKAAGFLSKCVVIIYAIEAVAGGVFGLDDIVLPSLKIVSIGLMVSIALNAVATKLQAIAIVEYRKLMVARAVHDGFTVKMTHLLLRS